MFDTISQQNFPYTVKTEIDAVDLAKFCVNRLTNAEDASKAPTIEACEQAVQEASLLVHDNECSFDAFKAAICAQRTSENPYGSELAKIIEEVMGSATALKKTDEEAGEMS